jgi:molybdenum cofactor guanylyltransferase
MREAGSIGGIFCAIALPMHDPGAIPVVILTGGVGVRMGGNKTTRILGGRSLLARSLDHTRSYSSHIAVATNRLNQDDLPAGTDCLVDEADHIGPISGLSSALNYAAARDASHVLIMPCDTPFLPEDLMSRLSTSIGTAGAAVAASNMRVHAACSLWRVDAAALLPAYLAQGRRSLIGFAEAIGYTQVEWPVTIFDPFFNVNHQQDLAQAELILATISG